MSGTEQLLDRSPSSSEPDSPVPPPPHPEAFLLKDLDTGMRSYVTDQEWVEKTTAIKTDGAPSKPPVVPTPENRWGDRTASAPKRARSDEIQSVSRTLRSSDLVRVLAQKKRDRDFTNLYRWQKVHAHKGPIRVLEFNLPGKKFNYLASAGQDKVIRIWDIDSRLEDNRANIFRGVSLSSHSGGNVEGASRVHSAYSFIRKGSPAVTFTGHKSDVTALSWSKNDFLLSGSVDRTIRLWHPRAKGYMRQLSHSNIVRNVAFHPTYEQGHMRQLSHSDAVTSVAFHPTDEQICISGTADGLVHMWHMKEGKPLSKAETDDMVTACAITPDGTTALVGTYHGRCKFYALFDEIQEEWQFKHTTQLDVRSRRAKNAQGKKICGFRFIGRTDKVLVSSNDSRLRLYQLDDKSVVSKFHGHQNNKSQLNGSFAPGGRYVLCASETKMVHIWEVDSAYSLTAEKSPAATPEDSATARKDRGGAYESFFAEEKDGHVTAAVFAPKRISREALNLRAAYTNSRTSGLVIVTASDEGYIRVFGCC